MYHYVYLITNTITNKKYIGKHSTENLQDGYLGSGVIIKKILSQGQRKILKKDILEFYQTEEEAYEGQIYYINKYNAVEDQTFYNLCQGGKNHPMTDQIKRKIGDKAKERFKDKTKHPMYGKHMSEQAKQKIRETYKEKYANGYQNPNKGKHLSEQQKQHLRQIRMGTKLSEQTKEKISLSLKKRFQENPELKKKNAHFGKENGFSKKVKCLNTGEIFDCVRDAMKWCGLKGSSDIGNQIKGKHKTAGKHPITKEPLKWEWVLDQEEEGD